MKKMGLQLWSVRQLLESDYYGILQKIVEFGYTSVQPAGYPGTTLEQAKAWYDELGLSVATTHSALPRGEKRDDVLREMDVLGCRDNYVSRGKTEFEKLDSMKQVIDEFNEAAEDVKKLGLRIGYHNHWWEFAEIENSGKSGYDMLIEECSPDVLFELDVYWAQVGGDNPAKIIERLGERCTVLHIKDGPGVRGEPNVAIGEGIMEYASVIPLAKHAEHAYVEFDSCATDALEAVRKSARYLIDNELAR